MADNKENSSINALDFLALFFFFLVSMWDFFTTALGVVGALGNKEITTMIIALIVAALVAVILIATFRIWAEKNDNERFWLIMRFVWFFSFAYDLYTSFLGNMQFISGDKYNVSTIIVVSGITFLVCISTIIVSYLIFKKKILADLS